MKRSCSYLCLLVVALVFASCSNDDDFKKETKAETAADAAQDLRKEGVLGVVNMPEMLTLSIMDSCPAQDMGSKMGKNYSLLEEEAQAIHADLGEHTPGIINYNGNPQNLKFECLLIIRKLPAKEPTKCKIVALEAGNMLLYNFYGPYENLVSGYNAIRSYCEKQHLKQDGPAREFYLTDPTVEKDSTKWLTRIIVPVAQ